ncbi:hypothetical protein POVCU1_006480 [Plasmodium ovale curtisi]|uniref:Uncharacterized protein n=1 Tax=Plasmodium ovale curtisi TaxID=864141 RepID=A0A1A8VR32_PLAOA|nr:hypothetical protein POVCU1_006480 [Plasmodium ovale curtisi]
MGTLRSNISVNGRRDHLPFKRMEHSHGGVAHVKLYVQLNKLADLTHSTHQKERREMKRGEKAKWRNGEMAKK